MSIKERLKAHRLLRNFRFKYRLSLTNERSLEEVYALHLSKYNMLTLILCGIFLIFLITGSILVFTPLRNYLPGYVDGKTRERIMINALKADSLEKALERQHHYMANIRSIFAGEIPKDTVSPRLLGKEEKVSPLPAGKKEAAFRQQYEEREAYSVMNVSPRQSTERRAALVVRTSDVKTPFDEAFPERGLILMSGLGTPLIATQKGTVLLYARTYADGNVLVVQHPGDVITICKGCGEPLKKTGDPVRPGEAIAMPVSKEEASKHPLRIELWERGTPVNPLNATLP